MKVYWQKNNQVWIKMQHSLALYISIFNTHMAIMNTLTHDLPDLHDSPENICLICTFDHVAHN